MFSYCFQWEWNFLKILYFYFYNNLFYPIIKEEKKLIKVEKNYIYHYFSYIYSNKKKRPLPIIYILQNIKKLENLIPEKVIHGTQLFFKNL